MGSLDFEGREVPVHEGDSVASALFRDGVRTFTRSLKHHRRRGLYCLTGDCPNCLVNVDGRPGVRACTEEAAPGQRVRREGGWPSTERDLLSVTDRLRPLMPVGFYTKTFIRPRVAWPVAERVIRRATGVGRLPVGVPPSVPTLRHAAPDVLVVGGGVAGLAAAVEARRTGATVLLCDEDRLGATVAPGPVRARIEALARDARAAGVEVLERATAIGIYEGPLVPVTADGETVQVEPGRVVVATGAVETHGVFPGNDLPGVWLGRGAARLAGAHGVPPCRRAVVVAGTEEAPEHAAVLRDAGVDVLLVAPSGRPRHVDGVRTVEGALVAAEGRRGVEAVVIEEAGRRRRVRCDALVLSLGLAPRDVLVRMAGDEPVVAVGDAAVPGCGLDEAEAGGRRAGAGTGASPAAAAEPPAAEPFAAEGVVCLCEDVEAHDLAVAWEEGWRSSEILKRYTTATMGPCQGAVCGRLLARFVAERRPEPAAGARTTARPPARPVALEALVAGVEETIERRTSLHERHRALGARLDRSGSWIRPYRYGEVGEEIRAVRERVGLMDVGTLGKLTIAGPDATALVDRVFPCRVDDLAPGRSRYLLALDEAGYVFDDGLLCALPEGRFFLTSTSGGADRIEAWLRDWADRWDLAAHVVPMTSALGAILVGGPAARTLLERLTEDPVDAATLPHMAHADVTVAGVPCRAIRTGFVGEVAVELHHPRSRGPELWDALLAAGDDLGCRPFGLDALDVLRLEKGHVYLGQDTLPDDHPGKLGLGFAVAADKPAFVGKVALARMAERPLERRLVGLRFDEPPQRGAPLEADGRIVGRVTSCARSDALGAHVGLGWLRAVDGTFPTTTRAGDATATVSATPFYDPEGVRLRA